MHDFGDNGPRHQRWRRFEHFARRGLRNMPGFLNVDWDGMGDNFRIGRMLASGDLRLVALYLIEEQPRHGYDLIKAIEERTNGFYSPSPGVVYPALTFLEEAGYVSSTAEGNKKSYAITEEGRAHLSQNRKAVESTLDHLGRVGRRWAEMREKLSEVDEGLRGRPAGDRDIKDVLPEVNAARRALKGAIAEAVKGDEATQRRLAEILERAAREIRELVSSDDVDL